MKNKIYLLIVFVATLAIASTHKQEFPRFLLGLEFLFALSLFACTREMKKQTQVRLHAAAVSVQKQENLCIEVGLKNKGFLPIPECRVVLGCEDVLTGKEDILTGVVMLDSYGKAVLKFVLSFDHCGPVRINIKQVEVTDYLGVFSAKWKTKSEIREISVIPGSDHQTREQEAISTETSAADGAINAEQKGDDPSEIFEIRPYLLGDKIQRIHWKMSAKTGELLVREQADTKDYYALLLLDLQRDTDVITRDEWDHFLETVASFARRMQNAGLAYYVCWIDVVHSRLVRFFVNHEEEMEQMLVALTGACPYASGDINSYYSEHFQEAQVCEIIKIDLKGSVLWENYDKA